MQIDSPSAMNNVAARIFSHLMNEWRIDDKDARLLVPWLSDQDYSDWRNSHLNSESTLSLELVSHLMAIYKLLHQTFSAPEQANAWVKKPNTNLSGNSAIDTIRNEGITGALKVRTLLEANVF